jgi:nucleotide-binding universal stress UspA family protein
MEKILYVTDAVRMNMQCLDFACFLCNLTHSRLTGAFLENLEYETRSKGALQEVGPGRPLPGKTVREIKEAYAEDTIQRFKDACEVREVRCNVHHDRGVPILEVLRESRYADLIIIDAGTSFTEAREGVPTGFVKDVLKQSECPVVLAPESFDGIDEIIFAYDNSRSAAFAIKQFIQLFPQLHDRKALILSIIEPGKSMIDKYKLKEWLKDHYDNLEFVIIEDRRPRARLLAYLLEKPHAFIVMGAYGRSLLSNFLSSSHAEPVAGTLAQPVFIAHD